MKDLIVSVESSLTTHNWFAALTVSLTLPDIAGKIDYPHMGSGKRYAAWFEDYVGYRYKSLVGPSSMNNLYTFLSGNDCYALRCAFLHEGKSEITQQRARNVIEDFLFVIPKKDSYYHKNQYNDTLQLQVDIFCNDILDGIKKWLNDIASDYNKQTELECFLKMYPIDFS